MPEVYEPMVEGAQRAKETLPALPVMEVDGRTALKESRVLLRFVEERSLLRVGGIHPLPVDVRPAATDCLWGAPGKIGCQTPVPSFRSPLSSYSAVSGSGGMAWR